MPKVDPKTLSEGMEERFQALEDEYNDKYSFPDCMFKRDHDHFHPEGECMSCDWKRQMLAATDWDDPNFIEAWDYPDYWNRIHKS